MCVELIPTGRQSYDFIYRAHLKRASGFQILWTDFEPRIEGVSGLLASSRGIWVSLKVRGIQVSVQADFRVVDERDTQIPMALGIF